MQWATPITDRCEQLIGALKRASYSQPQSGRRLVEFGSYVHGTILPGAVLDVAVVHSEPGNDPGSVRNDIQSFTDALQMHTSNFRLVPRPPGLEGPIRVLAGDFSANSCDVQQEIDFHVGNEATGRYDQLLRQALSYHPMARDFVVMVKDWVSHKRLSQVTGGSFPWTALAVVSLQQQQLIPSLVEIDSRIDEASPFITRLSATLEDAIDHFEHFLIECSPLQGFEPLLSTWVGEILQFRTEDWHLQVLVSLRIDFNTFVGFRAPNNNDERILPFRACAESWRQHTQAGSVCPVADRLSNRTLASTSPVNVEPNSEFFDRCHRLLQSFRAVARQILSAGWDVVPAGAYAQGTCLPQSALEVAVVPGDETAEPDQVTRSMMHRIVDALTTRTTHFRLQSPINEGDVAVKVYAGSFVDGSNDIAQELVFHAWCGGRAFEFDRLVCLALDRNVAARTFVKFVKFWVRNHDLVNEAEGKLPWTLVAIFSLQQQGVIPGFVDVAQRREDAQRPRLCSQPLQYSVLLLQMTKMLLRCAEQAESRFASVWTGTFLEESATITDIGCGYIPSNPRVAEQTRLLQDKLENSIHSSNFARGSGTPPAQSNPVYPSRPSRATPPPLLHETPAVPSFPENLTSASQESEIAIVRVSSQGTMPLSPQYSTGTSAGSQRATVAETAHGERRSMRMWSIDQNWCATARVGGQVVAELQLTPPEDDASFQQDRWVRRFNRREHQVLIGKITREYRVWSAHWREHGRSPNDPCTPRTPVMNSKSEFEKAYVQWRRRLGTLPAADGSA